MDGKKVVLPPGAAWVKIPTGGTLQAYVLMHDGCALARVDSDGDWMLRAGKWRLRCDNLEAAQQACEEALADQGCSGIRWEDTAIQAEATPPINAALVHLLRLRLTEVDAEADALRSLLCSARVSDWARSWKENQNE